MAMNESIVCLHRCDEACDHLFSFLGLLELPASSDISECGEGRIVDFQVEVLPDDFSSKISSLPTVTGNLLSKLWGLGWGMV